MNTWPFIDESVVGVFCFFTISRYSKVMVVHHGYCCSSNLQEPVESGDEVEAGWTNKATLYRMPSALMTASAPVAASSSCTSELNSTLPFAKTGMLTASLTAAMCFHEASPYMIIIRLGDVEKKGECNVRRGYLAAPAYVHDML